VSKPYIVYLRDSDLSRIGELPFSILDLRLMFSDVSKWQLTMSADVDIAGDIQFGQGIIVERDNQIILSGPITHIDYQWDSNSNQFVLSGVEETIVLFDRLASPVPSGPPYSASDYDVRTGVASTIMREYVNVNAAAGATVARRVAGLILGTPDPLVGSAVTGRARFDGLLTLLQSLALAAGDIGFRVVQSETTAEIIFQVYAPADKTLSVIFSPQLGNLRTFRYTADVADVNYVVVGGGGEGTARVFVEQGDIDSILYFDRRIEQFRDRRDTSDTTELAQTATEELAGGAARTSLQITPIDTDGLSFVTDYGLGDKVTVVANGAKRGRTVPPSVTIQDLIREIHITVNRDGETVEPSIGTPESGRYDLFRLFDRLSHTESRIGNLERR
jgi:hypothetical protein